MCKCTFMNVKVRGQPRCHVNSQPIFFFQTGFPIKLASCQCGKKDLSTKCRVPSVPVSQVLNYRHVPPHVHGISDVCLRYKAQS